MNLFKSLYAGAIILGSSACAIASDGQPSTVYHIKEITPENLVKIYKALGQPLNGKNIAVKISTGESNKTNHLDPNLIKDLVETVKGTIVECNTAYNGNRLSTADHLRTAKEHGYMDIAEVDIMDAPGDTIIPVSNGFHLPYDIVGKNFLNYDGMVVLSHFKGHQMGGFGGALKNISIGIGSSDGKTWIHSAGKTRNTSEIWSNRAEQDDFLESMADACQAITSWMGPENIVYINVANRLSVDCDCNANPEAPTMGDLGIYASLDPVALDRACVDAVINSNDPGKVHLIERINSRHGTHTLDAAEKLGVGSQAYVVVEIE